MVRHTALARRHGALRRCATKAPDGIRQEHIRETKGIQQWRTAAGLALLGALVVIAAVGGFGAPDTARTATGEAATLEVFGPRVIRTGEFFEMRFRVDATQPIADAVIVVDDEIWRDITVNTMLPAPTEESHENGKFRFGIGPIEAGASTLLKVDLQINPDFFGRNRGTIGLYDADELIAELTYHLEVLP